MQRLNITRNFTIFLVVLLLAGCGFHLRGDVNLPANMQVLYLQGVSEDSAFGAELASVLRGNGVKLVQQKSAAQSVLQVSNLRNDRRVLSVSGRTGKVREFEIIVSLSMTVKNVQGKVIMPRQELSQIRDYTFDETDVLGKEAEEQTLRLEMRRELIQQILRRLRTQA